MNKLPEMCYTLHPVDKQVIAIYRDESGYRGTAEMTVDNAKHLIPLHRLLCFYRLFV
jgi:hypothetical protein